MSPSVRLASVTDAAEVGTALARAFAADPVMLWTFPDQRSRLRRLAHLYRAIVRFEGVTRGVTLVAESNDSTVLGAAVWRPPQAGYRPAPDDVPFALAAGWALGPNMGRMISLGRAASRARPSTPHWYLQLLGVEPGMQHAGVGTSLVRQQLRTCDDDGEPAYLETTIENVPFYARFGFRVLSEITIHRSAPAQYALWREPQPVAAGTETDGPS